MKLIAKTLFGLEPLLQKELAQLGAKNIQPLNRAVEFEADLKTLYKVNIHSRTAIKVLLPLSNFTAHNDRHLYSQAQKINWSKYLSVDQTFAITSTTHGERFTHSLYAAQKLKDAIVDWFRENGGQRPSVDTSRPDVLFNLHIADTDASISMDSSGDSLQKRGYRTESNEAPVSEALAAAMLAFSGWKPGTPLLDPMTGSGTIAIEAAMLDQNIAPGMNRSFAFQNWADYDEALFKSLIEEAEQAIRPAQSLIIARDIEVDSLEIAQRNAARAGVEDSIRFEKQDFTTSDPISEEAMIIMNPPYGERLEEAEDVEELYQEIGSRLKHHFPGHTAWIISSNMTALKRIGLKPDKRIKLFNGPLECRFNKFTLFKGKRVEHVIQKKSGS